MNTLFSWTFTVYIKLMISPLMIHNLLINRVTNRKLNTFIQMHLNYTCVFSFMIHSILFENFFKFQLERLIQSDIGNISALHFFKNTNSELQFVFDT